MTDNELPMLAGIAGILRWCEELLNIVNGPLLLFGAGVALVDLLTSGELTVSLPILLYGWAISQALGIDTQLLGRFARARNTPGWPRVGWLLLGVVLGFAAWQAGDVFGVQQAQHITEAQALAQLRIDPALWIGWRAFLAVGLVALSGWTRYRKPAPASLGDERAQLALQLELEPLRARLREQQVGGWRAVAQTALQGAGMAHSPLAGIATDTRIEASQRAPTATQEGASAASQVTPDTSDLPTKPPTGGGSPAVASKPRAGNVTPITRKGMGRSPRRDKRTASRANARSGRRGKAEQRIRAALAQEPNITPDALAIRAGVSSSTVSKWLAVIEAEKRASGQVAQ